MRINEVDSTSNELVLLLRNLVSQANRKQQSSYLSWAALNNLMQNVGEEAFDYDGFKAHYDASPMIQKLVFKFDERGIELKTYGTDPKKSLAGDKEETNISKMAKNAAKRRVG